MVVGAMEVELHVHASRSLKEKRSVIRSIVSRVRNEFNVAVAEVGGQDTWQWAVLGMAAVGHDAVSVRAVLERVVDFIESLHLAEVRDQSLAVLEGNLHDYEDEEDEAADGENEDEEEDDDDDDDEPEIAQ